MRRIFLDPHAAAASVTLLPPPEFAVHEGLVDSEAGRNAR
jgi:hypothetical protein